MCAALTDEDGVPVATARVWREATDNRWHHGTIGFPITVQEGVGKTRAQNEAISKQPFRDGRRLHGTTVV